MYFVDSQPEFCGRCTAIVLALIVEEWCDPGLRNWFDMYHGPLDAGPLHGFIELLEPSRGICGISKYVNYIHKILNLSLIACTFYSRS